VTAIAIGTAIALPLLAVNWWQAGRRRSAPAA